MTNERDDMLYHFSPHSTAQLIYKHAESWLGFLDAFVSQTLEAIKANLMAGTFRNFNEAIRKDR
jgi:hypothetical protein